MGIEDENHTQPRKADADNDAHEELSTGYREPAGQHPYQQMTWDHDKRSRRPSNDDHASESSVTTNDELEMDHLTSDDGHSDDEETGLTKKERKKQKKWHRRPTDAHAQTDHGLHSSSEDGKVADRTLIRAMFVNSLLVGSWYVFSLSISMVSEATDYPLSQD